MNPECWLWLNADFCWMVIVNGKLLCWIVIVNSYSEFCVFVLWMLILNSDLLFRILFDGWCLMNDYAESWLWLDADVCWMVIVNGKLWWVVIVNCGWEFWILCVCVVNAYTK